MFIKLINTGNIHKVPRGKNILSNMSYFILIYLTNEMKLFVKQLLQKGNMAVVKNFLN